MCTARPSWQTIRFKQPQYKKKLFKINVNLVDVLEIDTSRKVCLRKFSFGESNIFF